MNKVANLSLIREPIKTRLWESVWGFLWRDTHNALNHKVYYNIWNSVINTIGFNARTDATNIINNKINHL